MKKCTLCIDRIYNDTIPEEDRIPACVRTCPAGARHFGDLGNPNSDVSILVAERGGFDLMPEQGTRPTNKYLPPRPRTPVANFAPDVSENTDVTLTGFFGWVDRTLSKLEKDAGGEG
jgi:hypothetical protein